MFFLSSASSCQRLAETDEEFVLVVSVQPFRILCQEMQPFSLVKRQTMNNLPRTQSKWGADCRQRARIYNWQHWLYGHKQLIIIWEEGVFDVLSTMDICYPVMKKTQDIFLACKEDIYCSDNSVVPEDAKCLSKMGIWEWRVT